MELWISILFNLISVLVGGFVTWIVARCYYKQAGQDLEKEAEKLRKLNTLILRGLEDAGLMDLVRDDSKEIVGMKVSLAGISGGKSSVTGDLIVKKAEKPKRSNTMSQNDD